MLEGSRSRERLARDYERKISLSLSSLSWLIYRINSPILRDLFVSSFDLFNTRHELITVLAGDFYGRRSLLSPLRRLQLAYGCLLLLSKFGLRLRQPRARMEFPRARRARTRSDLSCARKFAALDKQKSRGKIFTTSYEPKLSYRWDSGEAIGRYLEELKQGRLIARRCDGCQRVMIPPAHVLRALLSFDRRLGLRKRYRQDPHLFSAMSPGTCVA